MIITNIKDSIVKTLKTLYPSYEVYDETVKQCFEEPCFFVKIIEGNFNKEFGTRYKANVMFDITYFLDPNTEDLNEQYHTMAETLYQALELFVDISGGYLKGLNKRHDIQDGILHFFVDVSVNASIPPNEILMQALQDNYFVKE